jgi:hypothetical protein
MEERPAYGACRVDVSDFEYGVNIPKGLAKMAKGPTWLLMTDSMNADMQNVSSEAVQLDVLAAS